MDDLIRKQDAIDALNKEMEACKMPDERPVRFGLRMARNFVQDMPSAEPKSHVIANITFDEEKLKEICANAVQEIKSSAQPERKTGRWIFNQYDANPRIGNWHCSECGQITIMPHHVFNYCPHCGAKMEVEHEQV